jgi:AAHS family benzoate transporter-like MFS transporter
VPVLAKCLPESLSFLLAKGRTEQAHALASRYDVELPPAKTGGDTLGPSRWTSLAQLFRGGEWIQTLLYWVASFGGLLLVYGVATWLPTLMRSEGYELGSALTFVVLFNLGGIVGMLVAGRASDRFGAPRISAIWFALTAVGVFLLSVRMPLALTFTVVFLTGVFLNSAQTMIYATVSIRSTRRTAPPPSAGPPVWAASVPSSGRGLAASCSPRTRAIGASPPSRWRACPPWSSSAWPRYAVRAGWPGTARAGH